jgi:Uma2 family endonuclease
MHRDIDTRTFAHVTEPRPLHFAVEEFVPESVIHLIVRTFLYELLRFVLSGRAFVGSDQFVYFDGAQPERCVAPDVYMKWGDPGPQPIGSWKTWERGTPPLCVEIDNSAVPERRIADKLEHYRSMGVSELVYFAPEGEPGKRLRVWDRIDDDLVERVVENDTTWCATLKMQWVVRPIESASAGLRLAEDPEGRVLVLDRAESALARVAVLEAELQRRGR